MDDLLIYVAFLVIYLIFQVLGAKNKQKRKAQPQPDAPALPPGTQAAPEPTLDDALREIRRALGMEMPEPAPEPLPPPVPAPAQKPAPYVPSTPSRLPARKRPTEFVERTPHFSDAEFDAQPRGVEGFDDPHFAPPSPLDPAYGRPTRRAAVPPQSVLNALRSPDAARKAFLLHEILGPPRARR
ncbi:MAG: hypothetical protein R3247_16865 [Rhodothermales bacterium]|nr:hypothetical protein [Rhodothermales bacterium]